MATKVRQVARTTDRNGAPVCYEWRPKAARWVRIAGDEAAFAVGLGVAKWVPYRRTR